MRVFTVALCLSLFLPTSLSFAQQPTEPAPKTEPPTHEMTIEVGSRTVERSRTDTPVPVDVLPVSEVADEAGQLDLGQLLQFVAPSFNSNRQSGSDGSDHVDAATLRGLGPDQVLVLINGKRRHTSSLVYLFGTRGRGNVGTDLNSIPVSAIERIEILRDGASAQYGSDAIAGVINIVLKSGRDLDVVVSGGAYSAGDGENAQAAINYGVPIGGGTLNLTGEFLSRNKTNRATAGEPRQIGDAATDNATFFYNLDLPVGDKSTFYGHGGYNGRDGSAGAWYRGGVGSDDVPSRNSAAMYPQGFVPTITTDISDYSAAFGLRTVAGEWSLDVSSNYGANRMAYRIEDTLNASIATLNNGRSPAAFEAGGFRLTQHTTNADVSRFFKNRMQGVGVAAGVEYRRETYGIFAGEQGSWADFDGPGGGNAGSQGFPGFQPADVVRAHRASTAAYVDTDLQTTEKLLVAAAVRGEHFDDFGDTVTGKMAFGYKLSAPFHLRGSVSSGFRAPSLPQRYFSSTFTDFIAGKAADVKLAPNASELARRVGIPELHEETSLNLSAGFTWAPGPETELTVDAYQIDVNDRIVLTGGFSADDPDIGAILAAQNLVEARFFTNAIDTRTRGADLTLGRTHDFRGGRLAMTAALNLNETDVRRVNAAPGLAGKEDIYFNARERLFVEGSAPKTKAALSVDYDRHSWSGGLRLVYWGSLQVGTWTQLDDPASPPQTYDPRLTTDLRFTFALAPHLHLTVGGMNIFDAQPTRQDPLETENGALWDNVQMGINGAAFYTRLNYRLPAKR